MKLSVANELKSACQSLCKRFGGSELYDKNYSNMKEFEFEKLWREMKANVPFIVDIFNAVSGNTSIEDIKDGLKVKYCFLYSILKHERWNELSLLKRVNNLSYRRRLHETGVVFVYYIIFTMLSDQVISLFGFVLISCVNLSDFIRISFIWK